MSETGPKASQVTLSPGFSRNWEAGKGQGGTSAKRGLRAGLWNVQKGLRGRGGRLPGRQHVLWT